MKPKVLYLHGYGSNGNAFKALLLQEMMPQVEVIRPTFNYDALLPEEILREIRLLVEEHQPGMMVGSSMGGLFALCSTAFYEGKVVAVNPPHKVEETVSKVILSRGKELSPQEEAFIAAYRKLEQEVFLKLPQRESQITLALSTDDELLGNHTPLLDLFPLGKVIWKDSSGHVFTRFSELKDYLNLLWEQIVTNH